MKPKTETMWMAWHKGKRILDSIRKNRTDSGLHCLCNYDEKTNMEIRIKRVKVQITEAQQKKKVKR